MRRSEITRSAKGIQSLCDRTGLHSTTPGQTNSHEFNNNNRMIIMVIIIILIIKLPFIQQRFVQLFVLWST